MNMKSINWKRLFARLEKPVLFTTLGALLMLSVKNCSDGNKARQTNKIVKEVAADIDTIKFETKSDADTIKAYIKETYRVIRRTHDKVEDVQETLDELWVKMDSCCDCNKKPVVRKPVNRKPAQPKPVQPKPVQPVKKDTVVIVQPCDPKPVVRHPEPKPEVAVQCTTLRYYRHYR